MDGSGGLDRGEGQWPGPRQSRRSSRLSGWSPVLCTPLTSDGCRSRRAAEPDIRAGFARMPEPCVVPGLVLRPDVDVLHRPLECGPDVRRRSPAELGARSGTAPGIPGPSGSSPATPLLSFTPVPAAGDAVISVSTPAAATFTEARHRTSPTSHRRWPITRCIMPVCTVGSG